MNDTEVLYCKECGKDTKHYLLEEDPGRYSYECAVCGLIRRVSKPWPLERKRL